MKGDGIEALVWFMQLMRTDGDRLAENEEKGYKAVERSTSSRRGNSPIA